MRRWLHFFIRLTASRGVTPLILGSFALLYTGIAFYSDEALVSLMALIRNNPPLIVLLGCIPLNILAMLCGEAIRLIQRGRAAGLSAKELPAAGLYREAVNLEGSLQVEPLAERLGRVGYRYRVKVDMCSAWKGISIFPARALFLTGCACLFAGILLSLTTRISMRDALIEGEPLPEGVGIPGQVEQIVLRRYPGLILSHGLDMNIAMESTDTRKLQQFGLYPPGRINGSFFYPRYLGLAPLISFVPPEADQAFSSYIKLMIYPPGKEDGINLPRSPYKMSFTIAEPASGVDPYISGQFDLHFKVLKGTTPAMEGTVPLGGTVREGGYTLSFPQVKKLVAVDFVKDSGLPLIWAAGPLFVAAFAIYILVRLLAPRREMLFMQQGDLVWAYSRAEGRGEAHCSLFHGILDAISQEK